MSSMRCLQLIKPGSLSLVEKPAPQPEDGEVLLRVSNCALCRTDAKMFDRGHRDLTLPRVLGHEICGFEVAAGKRYVVWPGVSCGSCIQCLNGTENLCRQMQILGFHRDGGLADFVTVPEHSLIPIPDNLPDRVACLAEPLACTVNAIQQANLDTGNKLLIYGAGPVGLLMALAAAAAGVETWIAEQNLSKFQRSEPLRRSLNIHTDRNRAAPKFDAVINAAPTSETFTVGVKRLRAGGCFCVFSGLTDAAAIPAKIINEIHYRQLRVVGAYGCTSAQMKDAVELLSNFHKDVSIMIEQQIGLDQVRDALRQILTGDKLKFVVDLHPDNLPIM